MNWTEKKSKIRNLKYKKTKLLNKKKIAPNRTQTHDMNLKIKLPPKYQLLILHLMDKILVFLRIFLLFY